jgi:putative phosphoesterase
VRIGILSDTHVPEAPILFPEILEALAGVDVILHAGDIIVSRVLDELERVAPVIAAQGNHDPHLAGDPRVEPLHHLEFEGHTIALLHLFDPLTSDFASLSRRLLGGAQPDIVVCGDSHEERIDVIDGVLVINPGSATLPRNRSPRLGHVAFLLLERGHSPEANIVDLGEPDWRNHPSVRAGRSGDDGLD